MARSIRDPHATDRTPQVWIEVGGEDFRDVMEYAFDSDVLTIYDSFSLAIGNPDGIHSGKIAIGDTVNLSMASPDVEGGRRVPRLKGIVTGLRSTGRGGTKLLVSGADLGWHLADNDAPLWFRLSGERTFGQLLNLAKYTQIKTGNKVAEVDNGWGFTGFATENDQHARLNQGRTGIERSIAARADTGSGALQFIPPIQVETGTKIADLLIQYARREHRLVNVTADGVLVVWQPNYRKDADYRLEHHADAQRRERTNVLDATLEEKIDGRYTDVTCVSQRVVPPSLGVNQENPNRDKIRGRFQNTGSLPFLRRASFSDTDMLDQSQVNRRAEWYWQRGQFDSWVYTVEVEGHSQGGIFWAPDTLVAVDDSVNKIQGTYYISAVRYTRKPGQDGGTRSTLTIRKKGLLAA